MKEEKTLIIHVAEYVKSGCYNVSGSLGIQKMPAGYALMLNSDQTHFFWLRFDGIVSVIDWDKWSCYRGAKLNKLEENIK